MEEPLMKDIRSTAYASFLEEALTDLVELPV